MLKTFRNFMEEKNLKRKYIAVIYDKETQEKLQEWCEDNGFDLSKSYKGDNVSSFVFHTTVFHSKNKVNLENKNVKMSYGEAFPKNFKLLGENNDIPVLVVNSPDLKDLRDVYESMGLEDEWPSYIPHISLSYVRKKYDLSNLKLPEFRMKFGELKIEDIDEEI